jgi:catechol 2,3-dioxygenase-like lactoylglutathione lyase family enzyme
MMTPLGQVTQIGFMTRDIRRSIDYFVTHLGIGPWFLTEHASFATCRYRGQPSEVDLAVAFANARGMEFELMQLNAGGASMWREVLRGGFAREQMHHWCLWPTDYDALIGRAARLGYETLQDGGTARGRFAYLSDPANSDVVLEVTESTPARRAFQRLVAEARDPVRTSWTLPEQA